MGTRLMARVCLRKQRLGIAFFPGKPNTALQIIVAR